MAAQESITKLIENTAIDMANRHGGDAYKNLCRQWEVQYVPEVELIFKAAFSAGIKLGLETCVKLGKESE